MKDDSIVPFDSDQRPAEVFDVLMKANGKATTAPIEKTLEKIVKDGIGAVLVTDFEEYQDGKIYTQAYATPYFTEWMRKGGDIVFYVTDYNDGKKDMHLYYVVFDNKEHKLLKLVEEALEDKPKNYERFVLSTDNYVIITEYGNSKTGGTYHDENGEDIVSSSVENGSDDGFMKIDGFRAESYCFENSWSDIISNAAVQTKANGAKKIFTHLFRNAFVDFSEFDSYSINSLAVKVVDITDDFNQYWDYYVAQNNKPQIKHEDGELYLDFSGNEAGEQYYDEKTGKLKSEFDYPQKYKAPKEIKDMLEFDNNLFLSTLNKNPAKVELGIKFAKKAQSPQESSGKMYRIDVVIDKASCCSSERIDGLFGWNDNDCLSQAVKNTLQNMIPKGKSLYSYIVRIS